MTRITAPLCVAPSPWRPSRWLLHRHRIGFVSPGLILGLLILVLGSSPAAAHTSLLSSDPEDGASLTASPTQMTLIFTENVEAPAFVAVVAPDGSPVKVSSVQAVDRRATAQIEDASQQGRYTVSYRVVSADGHPVEGTIHYSVTAGRVVKQVATPDTQGFVHRHSAHLFWGILAAAVAVALLLAPLRRRDDPHDA